MSDLNVGVASEAEISIAIVTWAQKLSELYAHEQYFEAFLVLVAIIEAELRLLIAQYETTLRMSLQGVQYAPSKTRRAKLSELTIGELLKWLSVYCEDEAFLQKLRKLNRTRTKYIHNLVRETPAIVNESLKSEREAHLALLRELSEKTLVFSKELATKLKGDRL